MPGEYIVRIEVEEFASQMKRGGKAARMLGEGFKEGGGGKGEFCAGGVCEPNGI